MPRPPNEPLAFAVFGEDRAHWDLVRFLTDARIEESVSWVRDLPPIEDDIGDASVLTSVRRWLRSSAEQPWFDYRRRGRDRRLHGKHGPAALVVRRALLAIGDRVDAGELPAPDIVFLAMDVDRRRDRADGLRQELQERPPALRVVLVLPDPESEAWMVALFDPRTDAGREVLAALRRELSFDPSAEPHRLTSTVRGSPRDAKRVCALLMRGGWRDQISPTPFARIALVGGECGLASFVNDIDDAVIPRVDRSA